MTENEDKMGQKNTSVILGAALVVVIGGFAAWSLLKEEPAPPEPVVVAQLPAPEPPAPEPAPAPPAPEPEPEPEPAPPAPAPEPEPAPPKVVLPALEKSDPVVYQEVSDISTHRDFPSLFVNKDIVHRFVVFVDNMASGTVARDFSSFKPPISRFKVKETADGMVIDPASYQRYDTYLTILESADPKEMVALYRKYKPLIRQVYDDIGYPDHDFTDTILQAIDHVLATPVIREPIEVVSPRAMYQYKNEQLQSLTHVQRQALRLGPDNLEKLKPLLRKYRSLLAG